MSHGIIDTSTYLYNQVRWTYNGVVQVSSNQLMQCGITQSPASTNNPLILGLRAPAQWYAVKHRWFVSESKCTIRQLSTGDRWTAEGQVSSFSDADASPLVTLDPSLAADVLRKVLSQMLDDDVAFNAFMLQGKQSLSMVANLATGIAHGTDKLMTTEFRRPRVFKRFLRNASDKAIRKFSGKYLEFLYGWKPLADDLENAFSSMIDGYTGPEQKRFRLVVRKSRRVKSQVIVNREFSMYWDQNSKWSQSLGKENRAKVVIMYEFPTQVGEMLPTMTPFGTAWELTPWSFVIDWFVPVGDWIGALEASQYSVYMKHAVLTQSVKVAGNGGSNSYYTQRLAEPSGWTVTYSPAPRISGFGFIMTREVLSAGAVLDRTRFPDFSSKFGLPQASQALALLSQVLKKWF